MLSPTLQSVMDALIKRDFALVYSAPGPDADPFMVVLEHRTDAWADQVWLCSAVNVSGGLE
jgi:hypothetical protein